MFKRIAWTAFGMLVVLVYCLATGLVQLGYLEIYDNDPLLQPVKIAGVEGRTLVLEDGRRLAMLDYEAQEIIAMGDGRVDVGETDGFGEVYIRGPLFLCGTSLMRNCLIHIPILPIRVSAYIRKYVGHHRPAEAMNPSPTFTCCTGGESSHPNHLHQE